MRILFVSSEYPPDTGFGGIGTYTMHAAESLAARGHEVHVICRSADGSTLDLVQQGVILHRTGPGTYPLPQGRIWYFVRVILRYLILNSLSRLAWSREVMARFKQLADQKIFFDIVEFPECGAEGYHLCGANRSQKYVVRLHTPWSMVRKLDRIPECFADSLLLAFLERSVICKAQMVTSPSRALADLLRQRWKIPAVQVYPNPVAVPASSGQLDKKEWIYTGRIEYRKGVHILVDAYKLLCETDDPPPLRIVGRPYGVFPGSKTSFIDALTEQINRYQLASRIIVVPGVAGNEVANYLRASNVAIFPSCWENFPYACLEAMSLGCAVVASRCGGFPEMIDDGVSGLLFSPENVSDLAAALKRLLTSPKLLAKLGSAGRNKVITTFSREVIAQQSEMLYASVASRGMQ